MAVVGTEEGFLTTDRILKTQTVFPSSSSSPLSSTSPIADEVADNISAAILTQSAAMTAVTPMIL